MFKTLSTMTVLGLLTLSAAQAQSSQTVQAHVPFAFQMQHKAFAAGNYRLRYSIDSHMLYVRGIDGRSSGGFALVSPAGKSRHASKYGELVFNCYGSACFLAEIWQSADVGGARLQLSHSEPERRISLSLRAVSIPAK